MSQIDARNALGRRSIDGPSLVTRALVSCLTLWALLMSNAHADNYTAPISYRATGGSSCSHIVFPGETFDSGATASEACIADYQANVNPVVTVCDWQYYETGTRAWPEPANNATLWVSTAINHGSCSSPGFLAYLNRQATCPAGGTLSGGQCVTAPPCGQGLARGADGQCAAQTDR